MRALWSAASGMKAQQLNIDTISNNLANVNTTGFKKQRVEFKDLLYENLRLADFSEGEGRPVNLEVGHGVMSSATLRDFGSGSLEQTNNNFDLAVDGDGFFVVRDDNDKLFYTKDGSFKISTENGLTKLVTSEGNYVQGSNGDILLGENLESFAIDKSGAITVKSLDSTTINSIGTILVEKFANPAGLESVGGNLYKETAASGASASNTNGVAGSVLQGFLETSNVQVVDEMIKLITAQRAYEVNSKAIQTSDQMLEMANNLKR